MGNSRQLTLITVLAAFATIVALVITILTAIKVDITIIVSVVVPVLLFFATLLLVARRLYSVVTTTVNIAIGGPKGVGKTVYINVLCSQLTEGGSKELSFTPETRTAQQVFRAIGNLRDRQWPSETGGDRVDRYRGTIAFNYRSLWSILVSGRQVFKVEFGDAAGENWDRLADEADSKSVIRSGGSAEVPRLIDSSFFTYVGESDALFYLIDTSEFAISSNTTVEVVDDLLSTITLLRTIEGGSPGTRLARPISVILSKVDRLGSFERQALYDFASAGSSLLNESYTNNLERFTTADFIRSFRQISRLENVLNKQAANYHIFLVSSLTEINTRYQHIEPGSDMENSAQFDTEPPLEWTFYNLRKRRRFRPSTEIGW